MTLLNHSQTKPQRRPLQRGDELYGLTKQKVNGIPKEKEYNKTLLNYYNH